MSDSIKKRVIANPLVILREEFIDRAILFDPETGNTFGVNPIGVLVWKHLDGSYHLNDIADIVRTMVENPPYDVTAHIEAFLQTAVDLGLAAYEPE